MLPQVLPLHPIQVLPLPASEPALRPCSLEQVPRLLLAASEPVHRPCSLNAYDRQAPGGEGQLRRQGARRITAPDSPVPFAPRDGRPAACIANV